MNTLNDPQSKTAQNPEWIATIPNFFLELPAQTGNQTDSEYRDEIYKPAQDEALQAAFIGGGFNRRMPIGFFAQAAALNDMSDGLLLKQRVNDIYGRGFDAEVEEFLRAKNTFEATAELGDMLFFWANRIRLAGSDTPLTDTQKLWATFGGDSPQIDDFADFSTKANGQQFGQLLETNLKEARDFLDKSELPLDLTGVFHLADIGYDAFRKAVLSQLLASVDNPLAVAACVDIAKLVTRKGQHPAPLKQDSGAASKVLLPDVYDQSGGVEIKNPLGMLAIVDVLSEPNDDNIILTRGKIAP
jgi:hypothetical protein